MHISNIFCNFAGKIVLKMKKVVFFCMMSLVVLGMTSCNECRCDHSTKPGGTEPVCYYHAQTLDLVVNKNQWAFDDQMGMFYCSFDVPEITANVYNYGTFNLFREYNSGAQNAYQVALPETSYLSAEEDDGQTKKIVYYQQHIDYTVGIGVVEVFLTISDFFYDGFTPDAMHFRLQLIY